MNKGIEIFEDVIVWQRSRELVLFVYNLFRGSKNFGFKDQIQRAAISMGNNIAEGFIKKL
ncbi:MAG: hypothetical protein A2750_01155 [Candidatus Yanofskybacteria bacterium RIFCSPHIGHO2_01_FULL_45_42]|uniref:Four helix bundle protein n=3 Tax=Candidatus Yanofskyibacteriota TaxID=1752733 RepID=A0A1F8F4K2_9BACT|nr:MAG: hypothetical protein A2750_01155 [Candidatus Yanofskybacteria bacterium RIFCSPHIGHO2_01_FULL_45_42]OGN15516.1 MAG: hypothetical protein A3C81_01345 [Candidatus Yanofskybacteria bacterium RIFCSPHIGHO2_02_FULL_46_19]OGN26284.1 MAG: hypothetical protein A3B17_00955 [Candidatus Yanofskybacteria bacterium RIFCSPLOWO2_01_FULL_45_72]OGN31885.1 MAG: hypothetical protein A3J01_01890 [Candidatus Yanofskybacteria bacterium RIFCSPLOWO2_02_FULL_45_18]